MKTFGYIVAAVALVIGALHFGGYFDGSVNVQMTEKGRRAVNDGVESAKHGVKSGLQSVQDGLNKSLDEAQEGVKHE